MIAREFPIDLMANDKTLSPALHRLGRLTPSETSTPLEALREQHYGQDYLWLNQLLHRPAKLNFHR